MNELNMDEHWESRHAFKNALESKIYITSDPVSQRYIIIIPQEQKHGAPSSRCVDLKKTWTSMLS